MPRVKQALGSPPEDIPARIKAIWEELRDSVAYTDGLLGEVDDRLSKPIARLSISAKAWQRSYAKTGRTGNWPNGISKCA